MVNAATRYSNHRLKTRNALAHLVNGAFYRKGQDFALLEPIYDIDERGIERFMADLIIQEWEMPG